MTTRHSFAIDFITRKCKDDKTKALIYARITVDSERKEVSLKERIISSEWDSKNESVKGKSLQVKLINGTICETRFKIKQKYRELQEVDSLITAEIVKDAYLGIQVQESQREMYYLFIYTIHALN